MALVGSATSVSRNTCSGFLIAILDQQRPRLAEAAEVGSTSAHGRAPETTDRLLAMAQCVDQSAGAEPRLGQRWLQLRGAVIRSERSADVAHLFQADSQAEICVRITRAAGHGPLQCRDGIWHATNFEAGEAEIVLDSGIGRLKQSCLAQGRDRIGWSPGPE
jgi:hypothetical protein